MGFVPYFIYNAKSTGKQYILGEGTEVQLSREFCCRNDPNITPHLRSCAMAGVKVTSKFLYTYKDSDGKVTWCFNNASSKDFIWSRDVEAIVKPVFYVPPKTGKERIQEKFDNGTVMEYIWLDTILYIGCLIFSLVFHEWYLGWIGGTIIYYFTCKEKLSK